MTAGRPPLPTAIKENRGGKTTYRRESNQQEPVGTEFDNIPDPPEAANLNEHGVDMWMRNIPLLMSSKIITTLDIEAFVLLCQHYQVYKKAQLEIENGNILMTAVNKLGESRDYINPAVQIMRDFGKMVDRMLGEFGLNPSARSKVNANIKPGRNNKKKKDNADYNNLRKKDLTID